MGETYGEPPNGWVGNMERICDVESIDCGHSVRKVEDVESLKLNSAPDVQRKRNKNLRVRAVQVGADN